MSNLIYPAHEAAPTQTWMSVSTYVKTVALNSPFFFYIVPLSKRKKPLKPTFKGQCNVSSCFSLQFYDSAVTVTYSTSIIFTLK